MTLEAELATTQATLSWIDAALGEASIRSDDGSDLPQKIVGAACCFYQAIEHAFAIERLYAEPPHYGSAFALLRSVFESLVRGLWLLHCATNRQAENFLNKDKLRFSLDELIERVERHHVAFTNGKLSRLKAGAWESFCSFAHTGASQIARRIRPGEIVANYGEAEREEVLLAASFFALLAALEVAVLANSDVWRDVLLRIQSIGERQQVRQNPVG